eukprot:TRINITY_DN66285_c0_g1_i1.p1 TRINITY_DN66285_c0_g1~~TRINITY_DN66285_c0_g1_i1.p1  ORF type:complete len:586 (+),score=212.07 TRINITY_DN66285_c0_g1_i1:81-1760(+)
MDHHGDGYHHHGGQYDHAEAAGGHYVQDEPAGDYGADDDQTNGTQPLPESPGHAPRPPAPHAVAAEVGKRKCVELWAFLRWLTAGPTEDRRLHMTSKDEEFVQELLTRGESCRVVQNRPDLVLVYDAFLPTEWDLVSEREIDRVFELAADGEDRLDRDDLIKGLATPAAVEFLASKESYLRCLRNRPLVEKCWDVFVQGGTTLDRNDFRQFVTLVEKKILTVLEAAEHIRRRAYWGYGHEDSGYTPHAFWDEDDFDEQYVAPETFACCCLKLHNGWGEDLWYYLCQNHQLVSLFFSDIDHPLSQRERLVIEAALWGWTVLAAGLHNYVAAGAWGSWLQVAGCGQGDALQYCDDTGIVYESGAWPMAVQPLGGWYALFFVTIPAMLLYRLLVALHLCPCVFGEHHGGLWDASGHGKRGGPPAPSGGGCCGDSVRAHMTLLGRIVGVCTLALAALLGFVGITFWFKWVPSWWNQLLFLVVWRLHTYITQALLVVMVEFCPLALSPANPESLDGTLGALRPFCIGPIGQWERERLDYEHKRAQRQREDELNDPVYTQTYGAT